MLIEVQFEVQVKVANQEKGMRTEKEGNCEMGGDIHRA